MGEGAIHLLAYFASCNLSNINTVKMHFHTPAPVLPCRCGRKLEAVISHTALITVLRQNTRCLPVPPGGADGTERLPTDAQVDASER